MKLDNLTPTQLRNLANEAKAKAEAIEQSFETERHALDGCKLVAGFIYNLCATCGREENDMKECPHQGRIET
ncbi:hypothetical protein NBRC116590_03130 [Pelagimonas sp. KU-00592-HH]